jgi:ribulose-phosphate 3-epimerase
MTTFVPAILEHELPAASQILLALDGQVERVQVDFADQTLVPNRTLKPADWLHLKTHLILDGHLMVNRPMHYIATLAQAGFRRLVVHWECQEDLHRVERAIHQHQMTFGLVVSPETPIEKLTQRFQSLDYLQIMGVRPGFGQQQILATTFARIQQAHLLYPMATIAIDGGVRLSNAEQLLEAGASELIVGKGGFMTEITAWQQLIQAHDRF